MAKKRRRYHNKKKRKKYPVICLCEDKHHIFFTKRNWDEKNYRSLRDNHYCIVSIPRMTLHRLIHAGVHSVPLPDNELAGEVVKELRMLESMGLLHNTDSIGKRLMLLIALFDGDSPTTNALKEQLKIVRKFYGKSP